MILTLNPLLEQKSEVTVGNWTETSNRSAELYLEGHLEEALTVATKALAIEANVPTLVNMAVILEASGRFEEAINYAREAYLFAPHDGRAAVIYGEALLRMGKLSEGWPLYYKHRGTMESFRPLIREWIGQSLSGKRLLVIQGGGYGDNIYFLRWFDDLRNKGADITFLAPPTMASMVRYMGYKAVENWQGNVDINFKDYDYYASILSLAYKLNVTFENYRWNGPYIGKIKPFHFRKRIGLCAKAGEVLSPVKTRSLGNEQSEVIRIASGAKEITEYKDWMETVKVLSKLDLLITVDTGVAHLGGAMGIPTWVILPGASAWQYPINRGNHPFYPSMRMFFNKGAGIDNAVKSACEAIQGR